MHRSDISRLEIIQSEITGGPILQIEGNNGKMYGFYFNDLDVARFLNSVKIAQRKNIISKNLYRKCVDHLLSTNNE